jgi:hypothetical protein
MCCQVLRIYSMRTLCSFLWKRLKMSHYFVMLFRILSPLSIQRMETLNVPSPTVDVPRKHFLSRRAIFREGVAWLNSNTERQAKIRFPSGIPPASQMA